jgi:hypothetical protein
MMNGGDESNFVATDIEYRESSDLIGVRKALGHLRKILKALFSHNGVPARERRFGFGMFVREFIQPFPCNDVHWLAGSAYGKRSQFATTSGDHVL